ncbi:serine/threonine protein kinase [Leptothrix ochracea]|uniref:serine/threonine protein kinase n=2 Tax=Leptothrix ochracea TaxID=735331 RepID=UPI0034E1F3FE
MPGFYGSGTTALIMPTSPTPRSSASSTALPERIGKYQVLQRLGEGATSEVFLCHDPFKNEDVAIKRMRAHMQGGSTADNVFEHFFAAEAALAGRLHHPNVVRIHDAVADPEGPYLVMDYVPGTTLKTYCRPDQWLPLDQIVEIGFKCAMALNYCFRQGLIHRDIKPANILVVAHGQRVEDVRISDFGSVLNLRSDATQVFRVGSLAYMSPEQLDGDDLDCRADMYGLGAVLFHLITGRPPFLSNSQASLMHQVCHDPVPSLMGVRPDITEAFDTVIHRALAKKSADRYADWDQFAEALSALVRGRSLGDNPASASDVLDSERFHLLRKLEFFNGFDDVALWEVVRRAHWQRFRSGTALSRKGETDPTFHIIASGAVEIYREGQRVAHLGAGTTVGEMAYLAPNPEMRVRSVDVIVTETATTMSFTPDSLAQLSASCKPLFDQAFIKVLVRRLHAAHEALDHPRQILGH